MIIGENSGVVAWGWEYPGSGVETGGEVIEEGSENWHRSLLTVVVEGQTGERVAWLLERYFGRYRDWEFAFITLLKCSIDFSFQLWMAMAVLRLSLSSHSDVHERIMMCEVCGMTGYFDFVYGTLSRVEVDSPELAAVGNNGDLSISPKRSREVNLKSNFLVTKREAPTTILALKTDPCVHKRHKRTIKAFVVKRSGCC
jgi:hypothetical protein